MKHPNAIVVYELNEDGQKYIRCVLSSIALAEQYIAEAKPRWENSEFILWLAQLDVCDGRPYKANS